MQSLLAISGAGHVAALILVPMAGGYATLSLGTSGGPNHGEHPFLVNIIHLFVFAFTSRHWPHPLQYAYAGVLGAATLFAFVVHVQHIRGDWTDRPVLACRLAMAGLYAGMFGLLIFGRR
jgi:hypothetical protein